MKASEPIDAQLLERLRAVVSDGDVIPTLGPSGRPNEILAIEDDHVLVATHRSEGEGRVVPGWMLNLAWRMLNDAGELRAAELVEHAKRSSAVLALLVRLPEVEVVSSRPIVVRLRTSDLKPRTGSADRTGK